MSWNNLANIGEEHKQIKDNTKPKVPISRSCNYSYYIVFRIGKKYKSLNMIKGFERHMERQQETLNANPQLKGENKILIGNSDITGTVEKYLEGINIHKNNVIARELLITASPGFFRNIHPLVLQQWEEHCIGYLKSEFGGNLLYVCVHRDESTPHCHVIVCPKFYNEIKGQYYLSNKKYFGNKENLRGYQDRCGEYMHNKFPELNRGIRYSKAKHIEIKHFYTMINMQFNEHDFEYLCATSKNAQLLEIKLKAVQNTFKTYKKLLRATEKEKSELLCAKLDMQKNIKEIEKDKDLYKEALDVLSQTYKLPQNAIKQALQYAKNLDNERSL